MTEPGRPELQEGVVWARVGARFVVANHHLPKACWLRLVEPLDVAVLGACDGRSTAAEIAAATGAGEDEVVATLQRWERQAPGTVRWRRDPEAPEQAARRARAAAVARELFGGWQAAREQPTDNVRYHREVIADAMEQFESVETTISHAFGVPHPALGGRRYGEAFCQQLLPDGAIRQGASIVEIGCGTGRFARALLDELQRAAPELYASVGYTLFDLSPVLQASQRQLCAPHAAVTRFLSGNIEEHDFGPARFDLVLSNEVIADLSVGVADRGRLRDGATESVAEQQVARHGLQYDDAPERFLVNVGAVALLERMPTLLAPGGRAVLTEYGSERAYARAVTLGAHREHTIHFGHLRQAADRLGLSPRLSTLGDWLGFDAAWPCLDFAGFRLLAMVLLPFLGAAELPTLAFDPALLREQIGPVADHLGNLRYLPLAESETHNPFRFFALELSAPHPARNP